MIKPSLVFLTIGMGVSCATAVTAQQKISLGTAQAQCKLQGSLSNKVAVDDDLDTQIAQNYRACVFAKSGKYPTEQQKSGLRISGSARFGIVFRD